MTEELTIKYMRLDEAAKLRWRKNPKLHDIGAIVESIRRYGFVDTPGFDETLGAFTYGNGRDEALEWMHAQGDPLPPGVLLDTDGMWLMPYTSGVNQKTAEQAEALAIDHNNLSLSGGSFAPWEMARQWDMEGYTDVLSSLALSSSLPITVDGDALDGLLAAMIPEVVPGNGGDDFDTTPADGPTRCQPGDLWHIGPHRLLVGDCTDPATVARLMGGERAQAMVSDSPYGIDQEGITNDDPEGLRALFDGVLAVLPLDNGVVVNFQSTRLFPVWLDALRAVGQRFERMLWLYKAAQNTYPWRGWLLTSEAILASTKGNGQWNDHHPYAHDCYYVSEVSGEIPEGLGWHASVKPMSVVTDIMQRVCSSGALVYDPFLGSGTTLVAAHRTGRRCYGMEISPKYCDVILRRATAEGLECRLLTE